MANLIIIISKNGKKSLNITNFLNYTLPISDFILFYFICKDAKFHHQKKREKKTKKPSTSSQVALPCQARPQDYEESESAKPCLLPSTKLSLLYLGWCAYGGFA
jgi:hypothetical protein